MKSPAFMAHPPNATKAKQRLNRQITAQAGEAHARERKIGQPQIKNNSRDI
jgi:hypothetical protein